jgi:hypothetical protein
MSAVACNIFPVLFTDATPKTNYLNPLAPNDL